MLKAKKCHVSHISLSKDSLEVWNLEAGQPKEIVVSIPIPRALPKLKGVNNSPECRQLHRYMETMSRFPLTHTKQPTFFLPPTTP